MKIFKITTAVSVLALVAACGGGSTGGGGGGTSFSALADEFNSLGDDISFLNNQEADPGVFAELPDAGSASFDGVIALVTGAEGDFDSNDEDFEPFGVSDSEALGEIGLDVNFTTLDLEGEATNFVDSDNNAIRGTLEIRDGEVINLFSVATAGGSISGTLTNSDGETFTLQNGQILGFFTPEFDSIFGTVSAGLNSSVDGVEALGGVFVASE